MDADITLCTRDSLDKMLDALVQNPEYWISLDRLIKDVELKKTRAFRKAISSSFEDF